MPPQAIKGYSLVFKGPFGQFTGAQFHFSPNPERIDHRRRALTTLIDLPHHAIYRESHGEAIQDVTLEGTFGVKARLVNGTTLTGAQVHDTLEQLIENYWKRLPDERTLQVEYHDHGRNKHHYAEIMAFDSPRSTDNKLHSIYMIELELYTKIEQKLTTPQPDKLQIARQALSKFKKVLAFIKKVGSLGRGFRQLSKQLQDGLNEYILQPLTTLTTAIDDFVGGVTDIVLFPVRALNRIGGAVVNFLSDLNDISEETIATLANTLRQTRRTLNQLQRSPELFKPTLDAADDLVDAVEETLAPFDDPTNPLGTLTQAQATPGGRYTGVRKAKVRKGDTLQKLALREMGSAAQWEDIALLNGLDGNAALASLREVLIPVDAITPDSAVIGDLTDAKHATDDRLYGRDLQVIQTERGKLSVVFGPNNDLATVGGEDNLIQAVTLKTRIAQGTLLEDPAYGLRPLVGRPNSAEEEALALWGLQVAAESDPRIAEATVTQDTENNRTAFSCKLIPVGASGARPINTIVEAV